MLSWNYPCFLRGIIISDKKMQYTLYSMPLVHILFYKNIYKSLGYSSMPGFTKACKYSDKEK